MSASPPDPPEGTGGGPAPAVRASGDPPADLRERLQRGRLAYLWAYGVSQKRDAAEQSPAGSLRDRLRRLGAAGVARPPGPAGATRPSLRDGVEAPFRVEPPARGVPATDNSRVGVAGEGVEVIRARYGLAHRHGRCVLGDALAALGDTDAAQYLWLDTETTGLAGGTGTYAFLIGLAYVEGDALVTEQLLLRRLSAERHLLAALRDRLRRGARLVTFNGRRFDWPILEARFVLARQSPAVLEDHMDLIHPARRLWHRILGTHRLSTIEDAVLGAPRPDDVPGWQIPMIFVEYLRTTDRRLLDPILIHNRADLLAMILLHGEVARILRDPHAAGLSPPGGVPLDWEGAGVLLARDGRHEAAVGCFERAAAGTDEPRDRWRVLRRLVREHRVLGDTTKTQACWEDEAARWNRPDRFRAHVLEELAKARSRRGDREGAQRATEEALAVVRALRGEPPAARRDGTPARDLPLLAERLARRLNRLISTT